MKTICDANIILRYFIHDDDELYNAALKIIEKSPYVSLLVLSEVVYVLKGVYKISKNEIVDSLMALTEEIQFEDSELMIKILETLKS